MMPKKPAVPQRIQVGETNYISWKSSLLSRCVEYSTETDTCLLFLFYSGIQSAGAWVWRPIHWSGWRV